MKRLKTTAATSVFALLLAACGGAGSEDVGEPGTNSASEKVEPAANTADAPDLSEHETNAKALNAYFQEVFDENVARSPMTQTQLGIKTDYGKWDDESPERSLEDMELARTRIAEMRDRFSTVPLTPQAQLSYDLAEYQHGVSERAFAFRDHGYTFDQMRGVQSGIPAFLINQHQITSVSDAEAYISRLNGLPAYLDQHIANAKASGELGIRPPLFAYDYVLGDARNVIEGFPFEGGDGDSPLWDDFSGKVAKLKEDGVITNSDETRYTKLAATALKANVEPAYNRLIEYIEADKATTT